MTLAANENTTECVGPWWTIHNADCLDAMRDMDANSIDAIVTDPPYGLAFMGKNWDHGVPGEAFWCEAIRVAKPGGHLLAFGGTRTFHRLACAIEDAGWEIRDTVMWVYGSGFPKSQNIEKTMTKKRIDDADKWSGWGTALKPAWEPIIVARKPLCGTVIANVLEHGTGAINVGGCRVGNEEVTINTWNDGAKPFGGGAGHEYASRIAQGRWPANLVHDGSDEVLRLFPNSAGSGPARKLHRSAKPKQIGWGMNKNEADTVYLSDAGCGSAARFFYCAKANRKDRDDGCEKLEAKSVGHYAQNEWSRKNMGNTPDSERKPVHNTHPTVKPTDLMRYLCRLVTPPGGVVLDPFCGSGSTGKAAMLEGFSFIGIEREAEYADIARARIEHAANQAAQPDMLAAVGTEGL